MSTIRRERIGALVVFLLCAAAWSQLGAMRAEAALFPKLILGLSFPLTLAWMGSTFLPGFGGRGKAEGRSATPFMDNPRNLVLFVLCLTAYVGLIDFIGYFTATGLFMVAACLVLDFRRPWMIAAATTGFLGFMYVVFIIIFQRPLPLEFFQAG